MAALLYKTTGSLHTFLGIAPFLFILTKEENKMFPEYRDLISKLKQEDAHFARLFDEHNELDVRLQVWLIILLPAVLKKLRS